MARVPVVHIYCTADGESHIGRFEIEMKDQGDIGSLSDSIPGGSDGTMFRFTPGSYDFAPHVAPRRQFIANLDAGVKITTSDGESVVIGPGELIFVTDLQGKGHRSSSIEGKSRHSIFISVADSYRPKTTYEYV